jgi:hypothetical protein
VIACIDLCQFYFSLCILCIIHNKCSDFELVSPAYFGRDIIWHVPPDQKVYANAMTKAIFGKNVAKDEFASALMYRLLRKGGLKSNANNVSSPQLLVVWRSDNRYGYSVRVLLIKQDNTITLDEDKLKRLDYPNLTLLKNGHIIKNTWALDDTTVLITSKWEKQIRTIEITISKVTRENSCMKPLCISSNM